MSWKSNKLTELLGIHVPIIQAPMAGSTTPELAAAVTNAGGLGSLGCAFFNAEQFSGQCADADGVDREGECFRPCDDAAAHRAVRLGHDQARDIDGVLESRNGTG